MRLRFWPRRNRFRHKFKKTGWKTAWPTLVVGIVSVAATMTIGIATVTVNRHNTEETIDNSQLQFLRTQRASAYAKLLSDQKVIQEDVRNCSNTLLNETVDPPSLSDAAALAYRLGQERATLSADASLVSILSSTDIAKLASSVSDDWDVEAVSCLGAQFAFQSGGGKALDPQTIKYFEDMSVKVDPAARSSITLFVAAARKDLGN